MPGALTVPCVVDVEAAPAPCWVTETTGFKAVWPGGSGIESTAAPCCLVGAVSAVQGPARPSCPDATVGPRAGTPRARAGG
jgi:hypothetical protein